MKTLKNILYLQIVLFGLLLGGCYNDFDDPKPYKLYTDADFTGETLITVSQLKQLYYDRFGKSTINKGLEITEPYVLKGKLISSDATGNIYRTMYLQDATGGMEIKIGVSGIYNELKVGQTIYVKLKGLYLGNYRYMFSVGAASVDAKYPTGYIEVKELIDATIFPGERTKLTAGDTLVVNSPDRLNDDMLGCLVRFNGLKSYYGSWDGNTYPSFLEVLPTDSGENQYTDYSFVKVVADWKAYDEALAKYEADPEHNPMPAQPVSPRPAKEYPTFAFSNDNNHYYGSALFKFGAGDPNVKTENLLLYTSGYARFALAELPANGAEVNVTAIYTKYSSSSGGYIKYQLLLNNLTDLVVVKK